MAKNAFDILNKGRKLRDDLKVFVLTHSEEYQKDFETVRKMKTIGEVVCLNLSNCWNILRAA